MADQDSGWYSVRCVFRDRTEASGTPDGAGTDDDADGGASDYEERITLWRAESADRAIELAEEEADRYGARGGVEYLGIAQSYRLADDVGEGAEVFSLVRRSGLGPDAYLDSFFDTGSEREQDGEE